MNRTGPLSVPDVLEIFLQPGEFYFGDGNTRVRTLLGSCVAIVLWHVGRRLGGMCHFMLPRRPHGPRSEFLDGRYADEAVQMFLRELNATRTVPGDYTVKLFGGGRMLDIADRRLDIAARNVEVAQDLLLQHGFRLHSCDLGGQSHRNLMFDLWSGDTWMRRIERRTRPDSSE